LRQVFISAFDPNGQDYWDAPPRNSSHQKQVEASIVAWAVWLVRDRVLPRLTSTQRANIQAWLASCAQVPVRRNNWAWFTAVNQAARIALSQQWDEFSGDAASMLEDLKAIDAMAAPGDGWYTDSPDRPTYDYYNFWVFASHFLYWNRLVGERYPDWQARFGGRLRAFLAKTPYFFGGNGSHVLFGRSLIYRWAPLTPLTLAYEQKLWPHSPGLLRRIVRGNIEYFWRLGAFDTERGKLRETLSAGGSPAIHESYIDNGHPYWGMQAFSFLALPDSDPFWRAREDPLPVERADFLERFEGTHMLLCGTRSSGHVRWLQAQSANSNPDYADKYNKFLYSSHFPFNILKVKDRCAWDAALVFRDPATGVCSGRRDVVRGRLTADGVETEWKAQLGGRTVEVRTRIRLAGELDERTHQIRGLAPGLEILEGSPALGLEAGESYRSERDGEALWLTAARSGHCVATWNLTGYENLAPAESFGETGWSDANVTYPRMAVNTLRTVARGGEIVLRSLHYASPRPPARPPGGRF